MDMERIFTGLSHMEKELHQTPPDDIVTIVDNPTAPQIAITVGWDNNIPAIKEIGLTQSLLNDAKDISTYPPIQDGYITALINMCLWRSLSELRGEDWETIRNHILKNQQQ